MQGKAAWTILLYMNADKNGLDSAAIRTFGQLAAIGSDRNVNIVVQLDRSNDNPTGGAWNGALRFLIQEAMPPHAAYALPGFGGAVNSGDGRVLAEFVDWGRRAYPANRTMLIVWGHGRGYARLDESEISQTGSFSDAEVREQFAAVRDLVWLDGVTIDGTNDDPLFVREIADALYDSLDAKLDVIGFDTCLNGMLEVAYGVRKVAKVLVASEELEPNTGWTYGWLQSLKAAAQSYDGVALGRKIVETHRAARNSAPIVDTISALDLEQVDGVSARIDGLAAAAIAEGPTARQAILRARKLCLPFGARSTRLPHHGIDLSHFLDELQLEQSTTTALRNLARELQSGVDRLIIDSDSTESYEAPPFGASGIAIYFPATALLMKADPLLDSYLGKSRESAVEFSKDHRWLELLEWTLQFAGLARTTAQESRRYALDELLAQTQDVEGDDDRRLIESGPFHSSRPFLQNWPDTIVYLEWARTQTRSATLVRRVDCLIQLLGRARAGLFN